MLNPRQYMLFIKMLLNPNTGSSSNFWNKRLCENYIHEVETICCFYQGLYSEQTLDLVRVIKIEGK